MASMLEVMREYKHLTAKKRAEGKLSPSLEQRLAELEGVVKANRKSEPRGASPEVGSGPGREPAVSASPALAEEVRDTPPPAVVVATRPPDSVQDGASAAQRLDKQKSRPDWVMPRKVAPTNPSMPAPRAPQRSVPSAGAQPPPAPAKEERMRPRDVSVPSPPENRSDAKKYSFLDLVALKLPSELVPRIGIMAVMVAALMALDVGMCIAVGVPSDRVAGSVLPVLLFIAGGGWFLLYPGLTLWREHAANSGNAHINEPDFEARVPKMEPIVGMLTVLGLVLYVWLGGYTTAGLGYVAGILFCFLFGLAGCALAAILAVRPLAMAKVKTRALRQYLEAGAYHLNKGNPKRARRLLERAMEEARGSPKMNEIARQLRTATLQEADDLRKKGYNDRADELLSKQTSMPGFDVSQSRSESSEKGDLEVAAKSFVERIEASEGGALSASEVLASSSGPKLLQLHDVSIDDKRASRAPGPEDATARERARIFERKKRWREAFEVYLAAGVPVSPQLAEDAAQQYIQENMLRSADVIYEALGKRQIPEFYKAVAAEWARDSGGEPPPEACVRLALILSQLGEDEAAARIACRGALSKKGTPEERETATRLGLDLCKRLEMDPPFELLEAMGDFANAARGYEQEGRSEDALRAYRACADQYLEKKESPARLIPVLSKVFLLDPQVADKYLDPLASHVLETSASGPVSMKILTAYKKRKRADERLVARMFQLYCDAQQSEEAWAELEALGKMTSSNPEGCLKECRIFVDRFPEHLRARAQYVRTLLKLGRIDDAARQVQGYALRAKEQNADPKETIALVQTLLDWGHDDKELRKTLGLLKIDAQNQAEGLAEITRYVKEGGRDPQAIAVAKELLGDNLALPSGAPNHERLLRYGEFLLYAGDAEGAMQHLEVARASKDHRTEANLFLAQANLRLGSPKKSVQLLKDAIAGRPVKETMELNYELARAYESIGMKAEADRIDRALSNANSDFVLEYEKSRARIDPQDTSFAAESDFESETTNPTDVNPQRDPDQPVVAETRERDRLRSEGREHPALTPLSPERPPPPPLSVSPMSPESADAEPGHLGDTLLPRYRLLRKLGSGGMGEVHLAEDTDLGRYVAIKVLRRSLATDLFLAKFKEEARIVAQLQHPNIVGIYDLGQKGAWSYIVMEYVDGFDLATLVNKSGGFERKRLIKIVAGTAEAMAYAHGKGVIHRDLKPANILVGPQDTVKVTDFGIAKVLQPDGSQETAFSAAGLQVGTVNYMAPEQIRGAPVDARTDLYLLGTTLYVCLTGAFPFQGEAIAFQKVRNDPVPARSHVASISVELDACVMKCLARRPEDRFQNMLEFAEAVRKVPEVVGRRSARG